MPLEPDADNFNNYMPLFNKKQTHSKCHQYNTHTHTHTHTRLTARCPGLSGWAGTRKVKAIWILLKQETVSGSGISWAICKYAPRSRQITTTTPHHSVFLQAGRPSYRPTNSIKALKATNITECKTARFLTSLRLSPIGETQKTDNNCNCSVYYSAVHSNYSPRYKHTARLLLLLSFRFRAQD